METRMTYRSDYGTYHAAERDAFDPRSEPALFEGILSKRVFAFLVDAVIVLALMVPAAIVVAILGLFTLGLGWLIYGILLPLVAILYVAATLGGRHSATPGMRLAGIEMRTWSGGRMFGLLAVMHALLFWASVSLLTPLVLLVGLFTSRRQLLHDIALGVVMVNSDPLRRAGY
jgi:uncharacterized RDD family membrane protein YckC